MSTNEKKLLNLINKNENPEQAICIAIETISSFLGRYESYQEPSPDFLQELG